MRRILFTLAYVAIALPIGAAPTTTPISTSKADPNPKSLEVPQEVVLETKELVSKLGSLSFPERDQASRELHKRGRLALQALTEANRTSDNPEVQLRTELLLPHASTDDFKARIECFLADSESKYDHKLPGAKEYFGITGRSDAARNMFRAMVLSPNAKILMAIGGKASDLQDRINERKSELTGRINNGGVVIINGTAQQNGPSLVDMMTIFFAESIHPEKNNVPRVGTFSSANYLYQAALKSGVDGNDKDAVVPILTRWMETREDAASLYSCLNAATNMKLPGATKVALKLVTMKGATGLYRGRGLTYLAQHGGPEYIAEMLPLLKDETLVSTVFLGANKRQTIQIRDLALAMICHMTKQNTEDYGLAFRYKANGNNDQLKYNYTAYYFDGDDADKKRETAMKKWDEWYDKNKATLKK